MGGEREDYVAGKKSEKTETQGSVAGIIATGQRLRFHESAGQVHFHDDALKLKVAIPVADWWKAWDKLRVSPGRWDYFDSVNDTILTVETQLVGEPPGAEATLSLTRGVYGTNFKALDAFTKRK